MELEKWMRWKGNDRIESGTWGINRDERSAGKLMLDVAILLLTVSSILGIQGVLKWLARRTL
jgi:hypothetical protein